MVFGEMPVDHEWTTVELNKTFQNPVVVAGPLSLNDQEPAVVRIRNVNSNGFDIRLQEYQDGQHAKEEVSFLVMEMGNYILEDGTRIEALTFDTKAMYSSFDTTPFLSKFTTNPVVMTSITTFNGQRAVTGRIHNVSNNSFDYSLQEEEFSSEDHPQETVGCIAWEPSKGEIDGTQFEIATVQDMTHELQAVEYGQSFTKAPSILAAMQTVYESDTANLRYKEKTPNGFSVQIDEETSFDTEADHLFEEMGYISLNKSFDLIPQSQMSIVSVDSEELSAADGAAVNAIDGDSETIWHTEWSNSDPSHPHEIVIDLGSTYTITGLKYLPRQNGSENGMIADYEIYVSQDGYTWGDPVATGTWGDSLSEKKASFTGKDGLYVKLVALSEVNGNPWTSAAEINILGY
jgi:hypothetical protein